MGRGGGRQLSSWHAVYPSVGLCVCLNFSPSLSPTLSFVSFVCLPVCFNLSVFFLLSVHLSLSQFSNTLFLFFFPASTDDGWMNFALSSLCQTLHQEKQWETHKQGLENTHPIYFDSGGGGFVYVCAHVYVCVCTGVSHTDSCCK